MQQMGGACCCSAEPDSVTTSKIILANVHNHELQKEGSENQTDLLFKSAIEQFQILLQKHQLSDHKHQNVAKKLLHVWKEHVCGAIATNVKTGESVTITDPSIIQHKISIKTKGTARYLEYNAQEKVWSDRETTICLKTQLRKGPFGTVATLHRHRIEIPVAKYALQMYGILIPRKVLCEIGEYVNDISAAAEYNESGIFYSDLDDFTFPAYSGYTTNDAGEIGVSIDVITDVFETLFDKHYGKIIDQFNAKFTQFIENNKFYRISATKTTQLKLCDIKVRYTLKYHRDGDYTQQKQRGKYKFIGYLSGFNNLNLNQVVNYSDKNDDLCCITSDTFKIQWLYSNKDRSRSAWYDFFPIESSFEDDCNFLASTKQVKDKNSGWLLIDAHKLFDFINGKSKFKRLCDEAQTIILNFSDNARCSDTSKKALLDNRVQVKMLVQASEETQEDEIILD